MATAGDSAKRPGRFRFGLGNLLVAVAIVSIGLGWWRDHREQQKRIAALEEEVEYMQHFEDEVRGRGNSFRGYRKFMHAEQFIKFLKREPDRERFLASQRPFLITPAAQDAIPQLANLLEDPGEETRWRAVFTLSALRARPDVVLPALMLRLQTVDQLAFWEVFDALNQYPGPTPQMLEIIRTIATDDASPKAAMATTMLYQWDSTFDAGERFLALLDSDLPANRNGAAEELCLHVSTTTAKKALNARLEIEQDDSVRLTILHTLRSMRNSE